MDKDLLGQLQAMNAEQTQQKEKVNKLVGIFLEGVFNESDNSPMALKARHERIKKAIGDGIEPYWILWLFGELEEKVISKIINPLAWLPQTTNPTALKPYLPESLIENAEKTFRSRRATNAANAKYESKTKEHLVRKSWNIGMTRKETIDFKNNVAAKHNVTERTVGRWIKKWKTDIA